MQPPNGLWFTEDWFSSNTSRWTQLLSELIGQPGLRFLEIGCFEGRSSVWLLDNVLTHPDSRLDCIDAWDGFLTASTSYIGSDVEQRFDHNMLAIHAGDRVRKLKGKSAVVLRKLDRPTYDFIYIDASHEAPDVLRDAVLAFDLAKPNGLIVFDDYEWVCAPRDLERPRMAIDTFLSVYQEKCRVLDRGWQLTIQRLPLASEL